MADFEIAVELVLNHEGGYTPGLPDDPGGETKFGISKRAFPNLDIQNLTEDMAKNIYKQHYWSFDGIDNQSIANCLLDCAVNQGPSVADKLRNLSLKEIQISRLIRYTQLNKPQFYHSWFSRVLDV